MKELIDHIPFLDLIIVSMLVFFLWLGWNHGLPRLIMVVGATYTGFLMAAIYYHLFALAMAGAFHSKATYVTDLISFLILDAVVTLLMFALLMALFGHIEIRGRMAIFDKVGGTLMGFASGVIVVAILITLLRVPFEANKHQAGASTALPAVTLFNQGYERSALGPALVQAAPLLLSSVTPLLPPGAQDRGAVPLLASAINQQ